MTDNLIERLRNAFEGDSVNVKNIALRKAADALEAQARRIAELEAALRPFADHAGKINHELISAKTVFEARKGHTLYYGDLRAARAALGKKDD